MQVPIVSGIYADVTPDFRTGYPTNVEVVPKQQGISNGYLRMARGLRRLGERTGRGRGGIEWQGKLYRVFGTKLVSIDRTGAVVEIGDVGSGGPVSMVYSFDRLAITSGGRLYYVQGNTLTRVTDPDLGTALNVEWIAGYFVTTDGEFIVVTELNDPTQVDPLKYGSSEVDPDPIMAVRALRKELYAVNRYTVEAFSNVGGSGFPFSVISGAQSEVGAIGPDASCVFGGGIAVLGGGRNDAIGVYIAVNGGKEKISDQEIDTVLASYSESVLSGAYLETVTERNHEYLMIHLPDRVLCFDAKATAVMGDLAWTYRQGGDDADQAYPARHFVWFDGKLTVQEPFGGRYGYLDQTQCNQWGEVTKMKFGLPVLYNGAKAAQVHAIELVGLFEPDGTASVWTSEFSSDGVTWSNPRSVTVGSEGERGNRIRFMKDGLFRQRRMYRFEGYTNAPASIAAAELEIEGMAW